MAFDRPTLATLIARVQSDIATNLPGADARLRRTVEYAIARSIAGVGHGLHGHLVWLSKQLFPETAEGDFLVRRAAMHGLTRKDATPAAGNITITGTNASVCPADTLWVRNDGVRYVQDVDATISSGTATVAVTAEASGVDGNADVGSILSAVSPVSGINSSATVAAGGLTNGTDDEDIEDLRARLILRLQSAPKSGGVGDYVSWALEVSGVTRAWEYANYNGAGTVGVFFVLDEQTPSIIPDNDKLEEVQEYIEERAPITATVNVYAATEDEIDFTIELTPDTAAVREAVETALADFITRNSEPGGTLLLSQLNETISLAAGETDHTMTIPAANVTADNDHLPIMGTITWT